jgi:hypothetical protein
MERLRQASRFADARAAAASELTARNAVAGDG